MLAGDHADQRDSQLVDQLALRERLIEQQLDRPQLARAIGVRERPTDPRPHFGRIRLAGKTERGVIDGDAEELAKGGQQRGLAIEQARAHPQPRGLGLGVGVLAVELACARQFELEQAQPGRSTQLEQGIGAVEQELGVTTQAQPQHEASVRSREHGREPLGRRRVEAEVDQQATLAQRRRPTEARILGQHQRGPKRLAQGHGAATKQRPLGWCERPRVQPSSNRQPLAQGVADELQAIDLDLDRRELLGIPHAPKIYAAGVRGARQPGLTLPGFTLGQAGAARGRESARARPARARRPTRRA